MEKYIGFILLTPLVISSVIVSIMMIIDIIKTKKVENEINDQRKEWYKLMIEEQKMLNKKINEIPNNENKEEIKRRPGRPKKEEVK